MVRSQFAIAQMATKRVDLRKKVWPGIDESRLWHRKERKGFTTLPRTMPLILRIMDEIAKGAPVSGAYLELWCRSFDESYLAVDKPRDIAFASGFSGQRAERTWTARMRRLEEMGFIDVEPGPSGHFHFVLLFNPHLVVADLHKSGRVQAASWNALLQRMQEVGADDLAPAAASKSA